MRLTALRACSRRSVMRPNNLGAAEHDVGEAYGRLEGTTTDRTARIASISCRRIRSKCDQLAQRGAGKAL
jgi:hypothetical protein